MNSKNGSRILASNQSVRWARRAPRLVLMSIIALTLGLASASVAAGPFDSAKVEAADPPPGVQPAVQKWLKLREKSQIELNDALVPIVQKKIEQPGAAPPACRRLATVTKVLLTMSAAPHPKVDQLARAGLTKFEQGAAACLAGDLANAERLVAEGLTERAAAQEPFDETLDGD
jgi:hypothetical protein